MTKTVLINSKNQAIFKCPICGVSRIKNVSKYKKSKKAVTVKCKCKCGHAFKRIIEKRKQKRMDVQLYGMYMLIENGKDNGHGIVTISDISQAGIGFTLTPERKIKDGDRLVVICFQNIEKHASLIRENGIIRHNNTKYIGAEFCSKSQENNTFDFYLIN